MSGDVGEESQFKLVPNRADRSLFFRLAESGISEIQKEQNGWFYSTGRIIQSRAPLPVAAVHYFESQIYQFCVAGYTDEDMSNIGVATAYTSNDDEHTQRARLHALLNVFLNNLKLVVISLGAQDDAQVIFETLNSKSQPLNAMELVRNNIFQRASREGEYAEKLFEEGWKPLEAQFWHATAPRARPKRPRIDHFLSHALTAQTGSEISLRELYAEYRSFTQPKGKPRFSSVEEELNALLQFAPIYEALEENKYDPMLTWIGRKLMRWEVTTAYPVMFDVHVSESSDNEKQMIYKLLYSYLVRRMICKLTPKNMNKNCQQIVWLLLNYGVSVETFLSAFHNQTGGSVRFPSDDELRDSIKTERVYKNVSRKERIHDILWDIECGMRTGYNIDTPKPGDLSIEHIMPQSWGEVWGLCDGTKVDTFDVVMNPEKDNSVTRDAVEKREHAIQTLGNLTLVTRPGNAGASNSNFSDKKRWLRECKLKINDNIEGCEYWREKEIAERADRLADVAVQIWPGPGLKESQ